MNLNCARSIRCRSLYASKGQWREAFAATRRALEINSEHRITRRFRTRPRRKFEELFLSGKGG